MNVKREITIFPEYTIFMKDKFEIDFHPKLDFLRTNKRKCSFDTIK